LAHIPGLTVIVPSTPADAGGLMTAALQHDGPVIFMEHKLLSESWLEFMGSGARSTVHFDIPADGAKGNVPKKWKPLPIGEALPRQEGSDLTIVSVGVGVHRSLQAAHALEKEGVSSSVLDLRTVSPLDKNAIYESVSKTGHLLVVDEDYESFGLSGEISAIVLEAGISCKYARVCTKTTIPYARHLEDQTLPSAQRIYDNARQLLERI
jgi:pyruvate/2-oxoglutarate/acetoin dehydrogenase E1 component